MPCIPPILLLAANAMGHQMPCSMAVFVSGRSSASSKGSRGDLDLARVDLACGSTPFLEQTQKKYIWS